tara:strand:+ start:1588 stop:2832 length:1245 start_codon:yes stop_codon:yes gene_type:complete
MSKEEKINFFGFFLFFTLIFAFFSSEDLLGGAQHDFNYHKKFIILFSEDFFNTLRNYGSDSLIAQNSPVFYILISFLFKMGMDFESIRYLNIISIFVMIYIFFECLKIKFKNTDKYLLKILVLILFLSPTVRSLVVWPYPILWSFIVFLLSVKYYLFFCANKKDSFSNALGSSFYLAAAAYLTPNISVFIIFFLYKFFLKFKYSREFFYIIFFNILLALPAIIFLFANDFYFFKYSVVSVGSDVLYNIFNKILIISTIIFFYFLPFTNKKTWKNFFQELKNIKTNYLLILFCFFNIYFFNYPQGFGGGIFFHLSNVLFSNNLALFLVFITSIYTFKASGFVNFQNLLLFSCLILYNLQISIYHKYFDPLLIFIILFLSFNNFNTGKSEFLDIIKKYYYLYIFFIVASFYKVIFL